MIPILASLLPILGPTLAQNGLKILAGVFSGVADAGTQKVAELIEAKTGIKIDDIAQSRLDPNQWDELQRFEADHTDEILAAYSAIDANDTERQRIAAEDRDSARKMQMAALNSKDMMAQKFLYFLTIVLVLFVLGFAAYAALGMDYTKNPDNKEIVQYVLNVLLSGGLVLILSFFYGTSTGSKSKEDKDALRQMLGGEK